IQDVIDKHCVEVGDKDLKITYLPAEEMFPAVYDRQRIATVIDTLLNNAIQRSTEGSPIKIKAVSDTGFIRVSIIDEGEKLDDATLRQLFSKYFNDDNSKFGNSLGVAFAKNIIELQGGNIGVNNNENAGVTVWFEIPEADTPLAEAYTKRRRKLENTLPANPAETETVVDDIDTTPLTAIVVEEDVDLCMFITRQLQPFFNKVLHSFNGKDALILIKQNLPDIVISSVMLPIKSGLELCRDIKSSPETSHIPVVLLTAIKEGSTLETAYSAGADSYLSKPFDIQILLTRCRNLLHSRAVIRRRYAASAAPATTAPTIANADESFIMKIDKIISENISETDFGVNEIVDAMALSRSALYARFKSLTHTTLGQYIADKRLAIAKDMLANSSLSISEIAERVGFNSQRYFSTFFKERQNMSPSAYRTEARRQASS
ncbi:MAG: helix-turn-helix domain-containing protein, partial [Muribaculaceae bacterium]|nr:helix-turn-helix domain-containing protein [Muribaculaceae bacterium]